MKQLTILLILIYLSISLIAASSSPADNSAPENSSIESPADSAIVTNHKAIIETNLGTIELELWPEVAPKAVANFEKLSLEGFYDGTYFHRVIPDFMIQGGDPNTKDASRNNDGMGGPGYKFEDECSGNVDYGTLCMANSGPNTNGSQFFIVTKRDGCSWLNGKYSVFGKVTKGMDVVHIIEKLPRDSRDNPLATGQAIVNRITVN